MNFEVKRVPAGQVEGALSRAHMAFSSEYEAPAAGIEDELAGVWAFCLRIDRVGRRDDFFELGGDSLAATTIAGQICERFGVDFAPANIIDHATVAEQARLIGQLQVHAPQSDLPDCLVACHREGTRPPIFLVHGARGLTFFDRRFLDHLGSDQPIYLFQVPGLDGSPITFDTVGDIARTYVSAMQSVDAQGPYNIASICNGGFIGLEMCLQIKELGQSVKSFMVIDPPPVPATLAHLYPAHSKSGSRRLGALHATIKKLFLCAGNFMGGRGFVIDEAITAWANNLSRVRKKQERHLRKIKERWTSGEFPAGEQRFDPNDMVRASMALFLATQKYSPSGHYGGHAHMLVNNISGSSTVRDNFFWKTYVGTLDHETVAGDHHDLFDSNILLTADFIKRKIKQS